LMQQDNKCFLFSIITIYGVVQKRRIIHMLERHHIEGRPAEMIAENLQDAYNEHC
jgi:putative YphP/YqiW family bacilliredoxin